MSRTALFATFAAASIIVGAGAATAGTVFDFVPRMDFYDQPELVKKDTIDLTRVCVMSPSGKSNCTSKVREDVKTLPKAADK